MRALLEKFLAIEASSGILLGLATVLALILANSPLAPFYFSILEFPAGLSLHHWINDGLMTIFFFVVGMEIKKELLVGELASAKKAALPIFGALGGMVVPAFLYWLLNGGTTGAAGWGIPMATDIAFAIGVISLFGKRVPLSLKVFLLALAIVDDLGAVLVIAIFYTREISTFYLAACISIFILIALARFWGLRFLPAYVLLGAFAWFCLLRSGVHATVAGVALGFLTPIRLPNGESPLTQLVGRLHPWVNYFIMPIFALANAGVALRGLEIGPVLQHPICLGVGAGLFLGKPIGISLSVWLGSALRLCELPRGVRWMPLLGVGLLGGIGFTMALFISKLALSADLEVYSKVGILGGSLLSALAGAAILAAFLPKESRE